MTIDPFLSRKCHQPGDRLGRILGLRQCWSPGKTFLECVFSHRIVKAGRTQCQRLQSLCVSGLFISDYIPPEHLQDQFIKPAFMGFGKGFMGTAGCGVQSLYLQIKHILLPRRPLKIGAGCNSSSTPRGIKKKSVTSPQLFRKPVRCAAEAFLDKFSFKTLLGVRREEQWALCAW